MALSMTAGNGPAGFGFGPVANRDGSWSFQIHAVDARSVQLTFSNDGKNWFFREMNRQYDGVFHCVEDRIRPGARYWFVLDGEHGFADPWSRFQPDGPHEASQLIDGNAYCWNEASRGERPWEEAVLYELHIGAFTAEGTFVAAIKHLDHPSRLPAGGLNNCKVGISNLQNYSCFEVIARIKNNNHLVYVNLSPLMWESRKN